VTGKLPAEQQGCCATGCCSFNAVGPWASGEIIAGLVILCAQLFLFDRMQMVAVEVTGLVQTFNELVTSDQSFVRQMAESIPPAVITALDENVEQISNLPLAVIIPGLLSAVLLLIGGSCSLLPANKGSYCWSKLFMILADLFLLLSFVFYMIFAVIAVVLTFRPEVDVARGMCISVPATTTQLVVDNRAALNQLRDAGQDVSEIETQLNEIEELVSLVNSGCVHFDGFIEETFRVFLPAAICLIAVMYSLFVNRTLCCAAGCCKSPPKEPYQADQDGAELGKIQTEIRP